jgi:hypothetical protein
MKTNEVFLRAKSAKELRNLLIMDFKDDNGQRRKIIRLCLDMKRPYNLDTETIFIETETDIFYDDYSHEHIINVNGDNLKTCFFTDSSYYAHIHTFLKAIKKETDVKFKIVAFNNNDNYRQANFVCHSLYGILNDKDYYLLTTYFGPDNLAAPIRY